MYYFCFKNLYFQNLTPIKNEEKIKSFAYSTLQALQYMHSQGVIHTDLKLENILISSPEEEGEYPIVKICDFGLCHVIDQSTGLGKKAYMKVKCGTQGYIAPEQQRVNFYIVLIF